MTERRALSYCVISCAAPAATALMLVVCASTQASSTTLGECVRLALERSPAARAAAFESEAAIARARAARAAYAPTLQARAEYGASGGFDTTVTNGGSTAALLSFEATLLDGGLRDAQLAAARARWQSTTAIERQQRADIAFAVRAAYFSAIAAESEQAIEEEQISILRRYVGLLRRQEPPGFVPPNDVLRAELAVEAAEGVKRAVASELAVARDALATLTGIEIDPVALVDPDEVHFQAPAPEAVEAAPVLVEARAGVEAARREVDAALAERRSRLKLSADAGALGVHPERTFRDDGGGQFLLGFTLPIFDGGQIAGRIAASEAVAESAQAKMEAARDTLRLALARAAAAAVKAEADLAATRRSIPLASDHFQLMRARYLGGGDVRLLEVLDALGVLVDARLSVPRALLAYRSAAAVQAQGLGDATP